MKISTKVLGACFNNINLSLDYDNNHGYSGTNDEICVRFMSSHEERCSVPAEWQDSDFHPSSHWETLCNEGVNGEFFIYNKGNDAFLLDQVKIHDCYHPFTQHWTCAYWEEIGTVGSNNDKGWCLSGQNSDHTTFGNKAYQNRCCKGIRVSTHYTNSEWEFEWEWCGCPVSYFFHSLTGAPAMVILI